jgi:hypothetical protein
MDMNVETGLLGFAERAHIPHFLAHLRRSHAILHVVEKEKEEEFTRKTSPLPLTKSLKCGR